MSRFLTELDAELKPNSDNIWMLKAALIYESDLVGVIVVPKYFETDFASVPRVPIAYMAFGDRAHREAILHDFLYCKDSEPLVTYSQANAVFYEAMKLRGKGWFTRHMMWLGVVLGGWTAFHKRRVMDKL